MSQVIDTLVMLLGAFIIGWHLVPPGTAKSPPAEYARSEVQAAPSAASTPAPSPARESGTECPEYAETAYVTPAPARRAEPDPHELPEAYRAIIGPLPSGGA